MVCVVLFYGLQNNSICALPSMNFSLKFKGWSLPSNWAPQSPLCLPHTGNVNCIHKGIPSIVWPVNNSNYGFCCEKFKTCSKTTEQVRNHQFFSSLIYFKIHQFILIVLQKAVVMVVEETPVKTRRKTF